MISNLVVDVVDRVGSSAANGAGLTEVDAKETARDIRTLTFRNLAQEARIDSSDPRSAIWGQLAETLRDLERPAAVVVDPRTAFVTDVLVPEVGRIVALTESFDGAIGVHLDSSPAPLELPGDMPDARLTAIRLREAFAKGAEVVITTDRLDDLIRDVRELNRPINRGHRLSYFSTEDDVIDSVSIVSAPEAQGLFDEFVGQNCGFPVSATCLPFRYTKGYCFAFANFIVEALAAKGYTAGKAWLYGALQFKTENRRRCRQKWDYHVAAFLRLTNSFDRRELLVIDPIVRPDGPQPVKIWRATLNQPDLAAVITDSSVYRQSVPGHGVSEFGGETELNLQLARSELGALSKHDSPPYSWC